MTGYHLTIGYLSGGPSRDEAWEALKAVVAELRQDWRAICAETIRVEGGQPCEFHDFAMQYHPSAGDLTLSVREGPEPEIMQLASGGGPGRATKEKVRRAFCRLVIEQMHRREIEVNLNVA